MFIVTSLEPLPTRTSSGTVVSLYISCSWGPGYEQLFVKGNLSGVPGSHRDLLFVCFLGDTPLRRYIRPGGIEYVVLG